MSRNPIDPALPDFSNSVPLYRRLRELFTLNARVTRELQTPPICRVGLGVNQAATAGGADVIAFDTVTVDQCAWFDLTTHRYTPQVGGYYRVSLGLQVNNGTPVGNLVLGSIQKNGVDVAAGFVYGTTNVCFVGVSDIVSMNGATDYITANLLNTFTGGAPQIIGLPARTFLAIDYIGADQLP